MSVPELRWVVEGEALALAPLLERMGPGIAAALAEGRVFIDGKRAREPAELVAAGSVVEVFRARPAASEVVILGERPGLVAAYKPALLPTEPDQHGSRLTLLREAARLLGCAVTELHAVSRLDVGVSGVALLARSRGEQRLAPALSHERRYLAITQKCPAPPGGVWTSSIERRGRGAQSAETRYTVLARGAADAIAETREHGKLEPALVSLEPVTGRMHQLRIHAERAGASIFGDRVYGGVTRLSRKDGAVMELSRIALHAVSLSVPAQGGDFRVSAPVPAELVELWRTLGGRVEDFARA
jgi:23S rRNA-/tRNA-specific pseudouridylate synthase